MATYNVSDIPQLTMNVPEEYKQGVIRKTVAMMSHEAYGKPYVPIFFL